MNKAKLKQGLVYQGCLVAGLVLSCGSWAASPNPSPNTLTLLSGKAEAKADSPLEIHGFVKVDFNYDFAAKGEDVLNYQKIPFGQASTDKGHSRLHARQSRINLKKTVDSPVGKITGFIEGDFLGAGGNELLSNSTSFRIRQAWVKWDNWFIGQSWSTFVDVKSYPETVNLGNAAGQALLRQTQLRYTLNIDGIQLMVALENPESDLRVGNIAASTVSTQDRHPDLILRGIYKQDWGYLSTQLAYRTLVAVYSGNATEAAHREYESAYALALSGVIKSGEKNDFRFHFVSGDGAGRYLQESTNRAADLYIINDAQGLPSLSNSDFMLDTNKSYGGHIAYRHWWSESWRSNFSVGFAEIAADESIPDNVTATGTSESYKTALANVFYQLSPQLSVGTELSSTERQQQTVGMPALQGKYGRLEFSVLYKF
jgi:hypothetical protein